MPDHSGHRIDSYRLVRQLGTGGFGKVYLAEHIYRQHEVALKMLPKLPENDLAAFLNEARLIRLRHPHIVQVIDFGVDRRLQVPFLVMEYAPNGTMRQRHPRGSRVPLEQIIDYTNQIAAALQYAHDEQIIHRDVKPENILFGANNEVLVSDFGVAMIAQSISSYSMPRMVGTVSYAAPEQVRGRAEFASDQYSLAVMVYEWLSGKPPFTGTFMEIAGQHFTTPPPPLHDLIPEDVEKVLFTALAKKPAERFQSITAFALALEQALSSSPVSLNLPPIVAEQNPQSESALAQSSQETSMAVTLHTAVPSATTSPDTSTTPSASYFTPPPDKKGKISRNRLLIYAALVMTLILALLSGGWYFFSGRTQVDIPQTLRQVNTLIEQASSKIVPNPDIALQQLSEAQQKLSIIQKQPTSMNAAQQTQLKSLQDRLTSTVKLAISAYNQQASITPLSCLSSTTGVLNDSGFGETKAIGVIQNAKGEIFSYVLTGDERLYQISERRIPANPINLSTGADRPQVKLLASSGQRLSVLTFRQEGDYMLHTLTANDAGKLKDADITILDRALLKNELEPRFLAAWGSDVYLVLTSPTLQHSATILQFHTEKLSDPPKSTTLSISTDLVNIAAFPNKQLFFLFADGSIHSLRLDGTQKATSAVITRSTISTPLPIESSKFAATMPVPTPTPKNTPDTQSLTFLAVPGATLLAAGIIAKIPHLFLADNTHHRILDLVPQNNTDSTSVSPGNQGKPVAMQLLHQYTSVEFLPTIKSLVADPKNAALHMLIRGKTNDSASTHNLLSINLDQNNACTT